MLSNKTLRRETVNDNNTFDCRHKINTNTFPIKKKRVNKNYI